MKQWLAKSWFLAALLILLPGGMIIGGLMSESWRSATAGQIPPALTTVFILFLMSFSLDGGSLRHSALNPRPVLWGTWVNIGLLPLLAWPVVLSHELEDFSFGLMIAAAVPCTLATASVSTRQAGGNDAVSLLVTLLTNLIGVVLTPLWLRWSLSTEGEIDATPIIRSLTMTVLLPTISGQAARLIPRLKVFADQRKLQVGIAAQCLVLLIVTKTAIEAGGRLQTQGHWPRAVEFGRLTIECASLHLLAMFVAEMGGRMLRLNRPDRIATVFAGSQKTLPVGLLLASMPTITGGRSLPFITFPILLFHAVQLIVDTAIADWIARSTRTPHSAIPDVAPNSPQKKINPG